MRQRAEGEAAVLEALDLEEFRSAAEVADLSARGIRHIERILARLVDRGRVEKEKYARPAKYRRRK